MRDKIVSIIVVTRGVGNYPRSCLDSIRKQGYRNLETIVIDNSCNQNFGQEIISSYPEIRLYSQADNLFYTEALNRGIRASRGDFILCLNDDMTLDNRFIQEALRGFYLDTSVGMVSGKVLRSDRVTIDSTGLFLTPWRTVRERGYGTKDKNRFNSQEYILGVNGAVGFYRREMLENLKIGCDYFDPDFRIFYEDLDVAWRGKLFGWKAYYIPQAVAYHVRGGTVRQASGIGRSFARRYLNDELHLDLIKNRYLSIIKNESALGFILHLPFILSYDFLACVYVLSFKPYLLKRLISNLRYLKSALEKRKIIQNRRKRC